MLDLTKIVLYLGFLIFVIYSVLRSRNRLPDIFLKSALHSGYYSSQLLAYYTKGHDLLNVVSGEMQGMYYDVLITSNSNQRTEPWSKPGAMIYCLQLPFNTSAHLVGVSNKLKGILSELEMFIKSTNLETVTLEGDFPNYFSLYASVGQGAHARYVFDPAAMAYVVDYCQDFFWEIVGDNLYFVAEENNQQKSLIQASIDFVKQIEPAIKREFTTKESRTNERRRTHKKENIGNPFKCPACNATMKAYEHYQECPYGHGRLLQAVTLSNYRGKKLTDPPPLEPVNRDNANPIICPNCSSEMQIVNYAESGVHIDSCTNTRCLYRWLDAGELTKIISRK